MGDSVIFGIHSLETNLAMKTDIELQGEDMKAVVHEATNELITEPMRKLPRAGPRLPARTTLGVETLRGFIRCL